MGALAEQKRHRTAQKHEKHAKDVIFLPQNSHIPTFDFVEGARRASQDPSMSNVTPQKQGYFEFELYSHN
jgi:hypothetical protein